MTYLQKNLHKFLFPLQKSNLPVEIPPACLIYIHFRIYQNNLPHFFFWHQIYTIPVDIPHDYHIYYHMTSQGWSLPQLKNLYQVTLPVGIHPHSHKKTNQFTRIIHPTQEPSYLPSPLSLYHTSTPYVSSSTITNTGTSTIPSTGSPNLILSHIPYVIFNHSPSVPYLLPFFILDTVFYTLTLSSITP